jgi:hypothetical protein
MPNTRELHQFLVRHAERLEELHSVLSADLPKDDEGFTVYDGSDLSDALKALEDTALSLTRMAFRLTREGDKP